MVKKISGAEFETEARQAETAVVDFNATWCGPCRMMAPVLDALSEEMGDQVSFYAVDVDDNPDLAAEFRVQSIPCLVMLKKGVPVDQSVGFRPQPALAAWVKGNL